LIGVCEPGDEDEGELGENEIFLHIDSSNYENINRRNIDRV